MKKGRHYLFSDVSRILGVSKRTLINWENAGKTPKPRRDPMNDYRLYSQEDINKLKKITGRPL